MIFKESYCCVILYLPWGFWDPTSYDCFCWCYTNVISLFYSFIDIFKYALILAAILHPNVLNSHALGRVPHQRESGTSLCAECIVALYFCVTSSHLQHHSYLPRPWSIVPNLSMPYAVCMSLSTFPLNQEEHVPTLSIPI